MSVPGESFDDASGRRKPNPDIVGNTIENAAAPQMRTVIEVRELKKADRDVDLFLTGQL